MSMRRGYPIPNQHNQANMSDPSSHTQELLEKENDDLVQSLKSKVATLKNLTIDMGDEVRSHNAYLQGMESEFDSTGGLLTGSMKRLKGLSSAGHNRWMCYMILLILFVFIVLYFVIKWRRG